MLRTAIRPRWLILLLVALLLAAGMVLLGRWQLDRAREHGREPVERALRAQLHAMPVPLGQVIKARQTFPKDGVGVRVTIEGQWDDARRLLVADRSLAGRKGYWVLTPLRLADGSAVPVVRGWVADPSDPAAAPSAAATQTAVGLKAATGSGGQVQVIGLLEPSEPPVALAPGQGDGLPPDELTQIAATDLVNRWPFPLITGYLLQQTQVPPSAAVITAVPQPVPDTGLDLLNLFYALQWWVFAVVVLFLWWRLVRDDHERDDPQPQDDAAASVPDPDESSQPAEVGSPG